MPVGRVNGIELYWEQRAGGPRLLFCNGSGLALQDVRPLLDPLASSFELLAWDYRGFGRSAPVTRCWSCRPGSGWRAELKLVDSRWDQRWLEAHPVDRAIAEGMTAAGRDQQDSAAAAAYAAQLQAREGHDVWDRLGEITCPALVGYGKYDGIAPARNSEKIASRIRGAELHGYEGGHGFLFQDPPALPAFIAFLQAPAES